MNFASKVTHQSTTCEGVSFTIKKLSEGLRMKLRLALADANAKLRDLATEEAASVGAPDAERLGLLSRISTDVRDLMNDVLAPAWVRALLVSIDGLTIDEAPATPETLISDGPRELYREVVAAVQAEFGLTERERGESAPPTTSSAQVDGRTSDTSADAVDAPATT